MSNSLFVTATGARSGKSAVCLGLMQLLLQRVGKVAFFRPVISPGETDPRDNDIELIRSSFQLDMTYEECFAYTLAEAIELINNGNSAALMENIIGRFKELEETFDFVLCEGTDFLDADAAFEFDINSEIATNLGCPVLPVANARGRKVEDVINSALLSAESFLSKGLDVVAFVLNRVERSEAPEMKEKLAARLPEGKGIMVSTIPEETTLSMPSMMDVKNWLGAGVLYGADRLHSLIGDYIVAAMRIDNFLKYLAKDCLVIAPGDRSDIVLTSLASRLSSAYPDLSGVVLTGGIEPNWNVMQLIDGWGGVPVPMLISQDDTYTTARRLQSLYGKIDPANEKKIATALGLFERHVDQDHLADRLASVDTSRVTPQMFEYTIMRKAQDAKKRVVLPEGDSERILKATDILLRRRVADITLLGKEENIRTLSSHLGLDLSRATIVDPDTNPDTEEYAKQFFEIRKEKGITMEQARDALTDRSYYGTMMVEAGKVDAMVSGSTTTTQATIRPAFQIIKTKPGISIASSVFLMCLKTKVLVYGDCAVNPDPNPDELAQIAISSAETARKFGIEPRVAMLSYSTGTSGKGEEVDKVREATRLVKERAPELPVDGPMQYDAAIAPEVAKTKMPDSPVAGRATVFIFPDLDTGNNTYKAVQRSAGAVAMGPVLQGLNKPVLDLSRGCTVQDIVYTVAIAAILATE